MNQRHIGMSQLSESHRLFAGDRQNHADPSSACRLWPILLDPCLMDYIASAHSSCHCPPELVEYVPGRQRLQPPAAVRPESTASPSQLCSFPVRCPPSLPSNGADLIQFRTSLPGTGCRQQRRLPTRPPSDGKRTLVKATIFHTQAPLYVSRQDRASCKY